MGRRNERSPKSMKAETPTHRQSVGKELGEIGEGSVGGGGSEALGIASLPEILRDIRFPISKEGLLEMCGTSSIALPGGRTCDLGDLIAGYGRSEFGSMADVIGAAREGIRSRRLGGKESTVSDEGAERRREM
jgi:hypothetical protein